MEDRREPLGVHGVDLALRAGIALDGIFDRAAFCRRVERAEPDTKTAGTHITLLLRRSNAERPGGDGALGLHPGKDATLGLSCSRLRSEEHTSELQSLMRISYAVFCLKNKK